MSGNFEALPGGGAAVSLDEVEVSILRSLAVQLLELIGPGDEPAEGEDPLAALFQDGPSEPPSDPRWPGCSPTRTGSPARRRPTRTRSCALPPPSSAASPRTTCGPASGRTRSRSCAAWTAWCATGGPAAGWS